jgi:hypothetical protein
MRVVSIVGRRPELPNGEAVPRCRPGERPVWIPLPGEVSTEELRTRAERNRVGVDALAAVALEFALVTEALGQAAIAMDPLLAAIGVDLRAPRLAPTPALRMWEACLAGRHDAIADDLPELCLPARVVQGVGRRLGVLLTDARHDEDALTAERAATKHGRTLEGYVLTTVLLNRDSR